MRSLAALLRAPSSTNVRSSWRMVLSMREGLDGCRWGFGVNLVDVVNSCTRVWKELEFHAESLLRMMLEVVELCFLPCLGGERRTSLGKAKSFHRAMSDLVAEYSETSRVRVVAMGAPHELGRCRMVEHG